MVAGALSPTRPDQDAAVLIDREALALDEFVFKILEIRRHRAETGA